MIHLSISQPCLYSGALWIVNIRTHVGITGQRPLVNRVQRHQISDAGSLSRYWKQAFCFIEFKCAALKGSSGTSNKLEIAHLIQLYMEY